MEEAITCDQEVTNAADSAQNEEQINGHIPAPALKFNFTCKFCRAILFTSDDFHPHSADEGELCTSYFVSDPPACVKSPEEINGKITCFNCDARLGKWNWAGSKCSCSEWITPSFQFIKSKIDAKRITDDS